MSLLCVCSAEDKKWREGEVKDVRQTTMYRGQAMDMEENDERHVLILTR